MWSRRSLIAAGLAAMGNLGAARAANLWFPDTGSGINPDLLPPIESNIDFPIKPVDPLLIKPQFRRQIVDYQDFDSPNTIVVDPDKRYLFYVLPKSQAIRYGVGVGRAGFEWSGAAVVGLKRKWPRWVPPADMVDRDENAARWANGMPGGPGNPLGARALYLYEFEEDTLYRIHGTNQPASIGKAMSSGCVRMLNEDVADLYERVSLGTPVVVLPSEGEL